MNWDEKAEDRAGSWPTDPEHGDCLKCRINEQVREGFIMGAKWQRDQIQTDGTVERLANFLHNDDNGETLDEHDESCKIPHCQTRKIYADYARLAIEELLREEE